MKLTRAQEQVAPVQPPQRFMVCYDGSPSSMRALDGALDLAGPDTRVTVVFFSQVPAGQSLEHPARNQDWQAEVTIAAAIVNAKSRGHAIDTAVLRCHDRGRAQVAAAKEYDADIVFLGAESPEFGESFDKETDYVLRASPAKVVIFTT